MLCIVDQVLLPAIICLHLFMPGILCHGYTPALGQSGPVILLEELRL
jgi:hypothetical protein